MYFDYCSPAGFDLRLLALSAVSWLFTFGINVVFVIIHVWKAWFRYQMTHWISIIPGISVCFICVTGTVSGHFLGSRAAALGDFQHRLRHAYLQVYFCKLYRMQRRHQYSHVHADPQSMYLNLPTPKTCTMVFVFLFFLAEEQNMCLVISTKWKKKLLP